MTYKTNNSTFSIFRNKNWSPVPSVVSKLFLWRKPRVKTSDKLCPLGSVIDSSPVIVSTEYLPCNN